MRRLEFQDPRLDPQGWAQRLGVSREAVDLLLDSDVIDLHLDSFIWTRIFGVDLRKRHGTGLFGARFYGMVDIPRALEGGLTGATWVITTNPLRTALGRTEAFFQNLRRLQGILESVPEHVAVVRSAAEYRAARAEGRHGAFIGVQGGNAFDGDPESLARIPEGLILRVTVVHLSNSRLGATSAPGAGRRRDQGLTPLGREFVQRLDEQRIFVDLAHINREGFFDAVEVHDRTKPLLVTHTGVKAVTDHWRNLDDAQLRAVAETGGTVGVMYQSDFLGEPWWGGRAEAVVRHLEHIVDVAGEDCASLGSDWDGAICPPRDLQTPLDLPRLPEIMLRRGWKQDRIRKVLGGSFLRVVEALRG